MFKDVVPAILAEKKISISDYAKQIKVSRTTVYSWFAGTTEPDESNLKKTADFLKKSVSELVGEDEKIEYVDLTKWGVLKVIGNVPAGVAIEAMDSPENCSTVYSCRQQRELSDREAAVLSWPI